MPFTSFAKWAWSLNVTDFLHFKFPVLLSSSQKKKNLNSSKHLLLHSGVNTIWSNMMKSARTHGIWYHNQGHSPAFWQAGDCLENSPVQAPNICQLNPKLKINVSKHSLHILYLASTWFITHLTKWPSESVQLLVSLPLVALWLRIGERTHAWCVSGLVQVSRCCMTQHPLQPPHPKDLINSF